MANNAIGQSQAANRVSDNSRTALDNQPESIQSALLGPQPPSTPSVPPPVALDYGAYLNVSSEPNPLPPMHDEWNAYQASAPNWLHPIEPFEPTQMLYLGQSVIEQTGWGVPGLGIFQNPWADDMPGLAPESARHDHGQFKPHACNSRLLTYLLHSQSTVNQSARYASTA